MSFRRTAAVRSSSARYGVGFSVLSSTRFAYGIQIIHPPPFSLNSPYRLQRPKRCTSEDQGASSVMSVRAEMSTPASITCVQTAMVPCSLGVASKPANCRSRSGCLKHECRRTRSAFNPSFLHPSFYRAACKLPERVSLY